MNRNLGGVKRIMWHKTLWATMGEEKKGEFHLKKGF